MFKSRIACFILTLIGSAIQGAAHDLEARVELENLELRLQAHYEDGTPARDATAEISIGDGRVVHQGRVDQEGFFRFSLPIGDDVEVVLEDLTGHRISFPLTPEEVTQAMGGESIRLEHAHDGDGGHHSHDHGETFTDEDGWEYKEAHVHSQGPKNDDNHHHGRQEERSHRSEGEKPGPILLKSTTDRGGRFGDIASGLGYVLGITGILFYWLGYKEKSRGARASGN